MVKTKPDRKFKQPEQKPPERHGQRAGGPSMKAGSGRGGVKRQSRPQGAGREERSAVHDADAMSTVGGPADIYDRE
jgi:hypothetical protein